MALLTDLPNELLHEIMVIASKDGFHHKRLKNFALVNKQLRTVAFPLLVRLWNNYYGKPKLGLLALHLLRYPQHRSQLRTLIFQNYYADKGSQSPSGYRATFYQTLPHRPEILNELAEEAKRTLPDLAESSEGWIDRIRQGQEAGPGRKFSKLRNIDFSLLGINVWSKPTLDKAVEELNKVVELAKSRGVELDYYDYTDKEYRTTAVCVSTCDT
ncbi:hypothetical protein FPOAC2_12861 [Fusarium poae]